MDPRMSRRNLQEPEHGGAEEEDRLVAAGDGEAYVATWVVDDISDKVLELVLLRLHSDPPASSRQPARKRALLRRRCRRRAVSSPPLRSPRARPRGTTTPLAAVSPCGVRHAPGGFAHGCRLTVRPDTASWTIAETPTAAAALMASSSASHLRGATRWSPSPRRR